MSMDYVGTELELFAGATNWKAYLARQMGEFFYGRVLEVGAGIGANIMLLFNPNVSHWLALEPDVNLASQIEEKRVRREIPDGCVVVAGTIDDIPPSERFDVVVYVDVLEHIAADREEIAKAAGRLTPGGRLVILSPAHQYLFSPFDRSVGHVRRYDAASLSALTPSGCRIERIRLLDSAGFLLSLGNRLVTKSSMPTRAQIALWDKVFVPVSRVLDPLTGYRFGKSILLVWQATA